MPATRASRHRQRGAKRRLSGAGKKFAREIAMSDCLHCDIIELVRERLEGGEADLSEITAMMVEALAEVILLAPESEQAKVMADALAHFGNMFLEKSGAVEADPARAPH
jgi:hypothetical protein